MREKGQKNSGSSSSKIIMKMITVKRKIEKKVYTLPGQKHDPPEEVFAELSSISR